MNIQQDAHEYSTSSFPYIGIARILSLEELKPWTQRGWGSVWVWEEFLSQKMHALAHYTGVF